MSHYLTHHLLHELAIDRQRSLTEAAATYRQAKAARAARGQGAACRFPSLPIGPDFFDDAA